MARISKYALDTSISNLDKLVGTDAEDSNITKNFLIGDLSAFITGQSPGSPGSGTVTSVAATGSNGISITGSPITAEGTLTLSLIDGGVPITKLASSAITINGTSVSLGGSIAVDGAVTSLATNGTSGEATLISGVLNIPNYGASTETYIQVSRNFIHKEQTLSDAVLSVNILQGDSINVAERTTGNGGGAMWDVVLSSSVTENSYNIVQCTGIPTLSLVLRISDKVYHSQFGVVADSSTLDRTLGTDNSDALNAAFSVSYDLQKCSVLPAGAIRHTIPLIIQKAGDKSFTVESSKGGAGSGRTRLMFDADLSTPGNILANKNQCITYGGTMEFHGIGFTHNDTDRNLDTSCLFHTRTNIDTKQDIDHKFFDCLFTGAEYVATTYGRGWWCYDSDISGVRNVLRLEWPAGFDGTLLNSEQQLTTGMRGYRLMRNKIHASSNGHLIVNIGYNRKNANNIQVQNNDFDTPMGLLKGSARDSSFDNNNCLYATSVDFFILNDDKIENVTAKNIYAGVNTVDMNSPFFGVFSNTNGVIDGFDFSGSTFSHSLRTLFSNSGGSIYGLKINNCTFKDILQGNDTTADRYIYNDAGGTVVGNIEFVGNTISDYVRTFNTSALFDTNTGNCVNIKTHSNSFDVDTVPLMPVQLQGLLSNIHTFAYNGTGTDPLTVFSGTDGRSIMVAIVSERFGGATADKTFMTNDQGTSSDPFYLSADKRNVFAKFDCNTLGGYYQVTLIY